MQTVETGHATNDRNGQEASTTFGGDLEVTRSVLHNPDQMWTFNSVTFPS